MKSWADHCSDSEDEDALHHPAAAATAASPPAWHESSSEDEADQAAADEAPLPEPVPARTYTPADIPPGGPPFTAFVGNLPFSIKSPDDLVGEVQQLIGGDAGVSRARLGKDRKTGKMGGFGYIEFHTAEDLLALLNLPNQPPQIRGRDIKVDVAEQRQQPSGGGGDRGDRGASFRGSGRGSRTNLSGNLDDIDGSKFRGGRGSMGRDGSGRNDGGSSNNNNNNRRNNNRQSNQRKDDGNSTNNSGGPPPVRQSLKLAPRSKPAEGAGRSSSSSIFGDARPRDEAAWEAEREKRSSLAKAAEDSKKEKKKDGSSTGGDGGDGGKGGERGGDNKKDKDMRRSGSSTSVGKGGRGGGGAKRNNSTKSGGGKGGRGGGSGGGGKGGRGGSMRKSDSQKSAGGGNGEKKKHEPTVPKSAIVAPPAEKKKDDKKVVNKFAALGFDSDSD